MGQLLDGLRLTVGGCLMVEVDEVLDAQPIDVGIISHALTGKILAEIGTIRANDFGKLKKCQVMLQVELRVDAILL